MTIFSPVAIYPCVFLLLSVVAFGVGFTNPFLFDDTVIIQENEWLRSEYILGFFRSFIPDSKLTFPGYRPLVLTTFALQKEWLGASPWSFRLVNLILHVCVTTLVFGLARRLFRRYARDEGVALPLLASLFFLIHPVQTNIFTLVWKRSDLLVSLGILGAIYFSTRWNENRGVRWLVGVWISTLVAVFSKESALILPAALILCDLFVWERKQDLRSRVAWIYIPTILICVTLAYLIFAVMPATLADMNFSKEPFAPPSYVLGRGEYFKSQAVSLLKYLELAFFPINLNVFHYISPVRTNEHPLFWFGLAVFTALLYVAYRYRTASPLISFSILWFLLFLLPASSFVPLFMSFDEVRLYLPLAGAGLLFALGFNRASNWAKQKNWKIVIRALPTAVVLILVLYIAQDALRVRVWRSPLSLWGMNALDEPEDARAWLGLGMTFDSMGQYDRAEEAFGQAIAAEPAYGVAYYFRGKTAMMRRKFDEAENYLTVAYSLGAMPHEVLTMMAVNATAREDPAEAARYFTLSLNKAPGESATYRNLAMLLEDQREIAGAISALRIALRLDPTNTDTQKRLERLLP
jgi:protein O-mannosyl-transferase